MTIGNSYDFNHPVRDVNELFTTLIVKPTSFLGRIGITAGQQIRAAEIEWFNDVLSPKQTSITSFDTDGDGTGINVASTSGILPGAILRFSTSADVSRDEQVQVTSVDSATDLTVVRDYAGSTGETFVVGDKVFLIANPVNEGTDVGTGTIHQATLLNNYVQIFDATAQITKTALAIQTYDGYNALDRQIEVKMRDLQWEMENSLIHGLKLKRTSSIQGTMGGVRQFITGSGGNITTANSAISSTLINDALEQILSKGGNSNNLALLCNTNQARKITALNTSGQNPVVNEIDPVNRTMGNRVTQFMGDIPIAGGMSASMFVNENMRKDEIMLLDLDKISLKTLRPMLSEPATQPGSASIKRRLSAEMSMEIRNPLEAHAIIKALTV